MENLKTSLSDEHKSIVKEVVLRELRILFISDIHLGVASIDPYEMAANLEAVIIKKLDETDILFINGDLFETQIPFNNVSFDPIYEVIVDIMRKCHERGIVLRVMLGTFSHDRRQCERLMSFYRKHQFTNSFRYIDAIDVEEINTRDRSIRVLYVPDDMPYGSSDEIAAVCREKVQAMGWDTVDYGCFHGFFDFTFPSGVSAEKAIVFREDQFPYITKLIDIGHVHKFAANGKCVSNGSFDRLRFSEEEAKGYVFVEDYGSSIKTQFIENELAARFDTLTFSLGDTTKSISDIVNRHIAGITLNRRLHLRLEIENNEIRAAIRKWMSDQHPEVICMCNKLPSKDRQTITLTKTPLIEQRKKIPAPTRDNIAAHIKRMIGDSLDVSVETIEAYLQPIAK